MRPSILILFRFIRVPIILIFIALVLALSGCGSRLAGNSTGVDNPEIVVAFRDSTGMALRVTGDLNLYSTEQNPTVSPEPLWTKKLYENAIIKLSAYDISQINKAAAKIGATKTAAAKISAGSSEIPFAFNLQLKTEDHKGQFAFGLVYDSVAKIFTQPGMPSGSAPLSRLEMQVHPLVRYQAQISKDSLGSTLNRVFIPGTPFQATLVNNVFTFEDLPQGSFPLRFLTADGHVFAVKESLDTKAPSNFTLKEGPISIVVPDNHPAVDSLISIDAGPDREVFLEAPSFLSASVKGVDSANPRLAIVWRQLNRIGDSALAGDTILHPTQMHTEIHFLGEGVYTFQVSATLGSQSKADTVVLSVKKIPPPPHPRIIQPRLNDTLRAGIAYPITWEMPQPGPVTIRASANNGEKWIVLVEHLDVKGGPAIFNWTPTAEFGTTVRGLVQVRLVADTSVVAESGGFFSVVH